MTRFVIDSNGRTLELESTRFATDPAALDFALRNLGIVSIEPEPQGALGVRCNPSRMTEAAFAELMATICATVRLPIALSVFSNRWHRGPLIDADRTVARLLQLRAQTWRPDGRFLADRRRIGDLARDDPLRGILDLWRWLGGSFNPSVLTPVLKQRLNGKYVVASGSVGRRADLMFRDVGPGVLIYDQGWPGRTRGLRLQDQPDYLLGRHTLDTYREVMVEGEPRFDAVDLMICWPRKGRVRRTFRRLLLPFRNHDERIVLCATCADSAIDLRFRVDHPRECRVDHLVGGHEDESEAQR